MESRKTLVKAVFPYLEIEPSKTKEENYDAYFDELEAYLKAEQEALEKSSAVGGKAEK